MMKTLGMAMFVLACAWCALAADVRAAEPATPTHAIKIFSGEKRFFGTYGPSTSVGYPARLQRKFYRYTGKSGAACPLQISNFSIGGVPWRMPGWVDCKPVQGDPTKFEAIRSPRYISTIQKLIKDNPGTPVIVLAMNNTGYAMTGMDTPAPTRILGPNDTAHINLAKNFLRTHIHAILDDGAAMYFLSPKKYWRVMDDPNEWSHNEEKFAVAKLAEEKIPGFVYVKGVWEDTAKYKATALQGDGHHPTAFGDEIIASKFFRALLEHDGLPVPPGDQEEVDTVRKYFETKGAQGSLDPWKP